MSSINRFPMIKYNNLCKVCQAVKDNKKLLDRIYDAAYNPSTKDSLYKVSSQHPEFSYPSLLNHTKKHQFLTESQADQKKVQSMAEKSETAILQKVIGHTDVRQQIMQKGMEKLEAGEMQLNAGHLLKAAKDQKDYEEKAADRQVAIMDMIFHYTSNEANKRGMYDRRIIEGQASANDDPAYGTTGYINPGENEPGPVHNGDAGDAAPYWPSTIPQGVRQEESEA